MMSSCALDFLLDSLGDSVFLCCGCRIYRCGHVVTGQRNVVSQNLGLGGNRIVWHIDKSVQLLYFIGGICMQINALKSGFIDQFGHSSYRIIFIYHVHSHQDLSFGKEVIVDIPKECIPFMEGRIRLDFKEKLSIERCFGEPMNIPLSPDVYGVSRDSSA